MKCYLGVFACDVPNVLSFLADDESMQPVWCHDTRKHNAVRLLEITIVGKINKTFVKVNSFLLVFKHFVKIIFMGPDWVIIVVFG